MITSMSAQLFAFAGSGLTGRPILMLLTLAVLVILVLVLIRRQRMRAARLLPVARDILIENMAESVLVFDNDDRLLDLNKAAAQNFELSEDRSIGQKAEVLFERWPGLLAELVHVAEAHAGIEVTTTQNNYLDVSILPLGDRKSAQIGYMLVGRDVTMRKEAERALTVALDDMESRVGERTLELEEANTHLRHLQNLLSNVINSMPSMLIGVDKDGIVLEWNAEAERLTGIQANVAEGKGLDRLMPQLTSEMAAVQDAIARRQSVRRPRVQRRFLGENRLTDTTVYPLVGNSQEGAVIRIDDVTEQARIQEMMIQAEKMLSVGGLAAGMAHEINNPLAGILQNLQVIERRFDAALEKNINTAEACGTNLGAINTYLDERGISRMLGAVSDSGLRAAKIVENMLSFSRKSESRFLSVEMTALLERTIDLLQNDYNLKLGYDFRTVKIVREFGGDIPCVECDENTIQQVLVNVLRNCAQAMFTKKYGAGETPTITLTMTSTETKWSLTIRDNGPGMEESVQKRVFEPFFSTKAEGAGTGLGLSVSYFIITTNHQGSITVESEVGEGTAFIISLPIVMKKSVQ